MTNPKSTIKMQLKRVIRPIRHVESIADVHSVISLLGAAI